MNSVVRRAQAGERAALAELIESHQAQVYSLCLAMMREPCDAADLTQETFLRVVRSLHTFEGERASFATWLHRLTVNACLDALRRRKRAPVGLNDLAEPRSADRWGEPEWHAEWHESIGEVQAALSELPQPQRVALTLFYFDERSYEHIAAVMRLPMNTVKSHLLRGKQRLARLFRNQRLSFVAA
jgi:RNA polymerase sigma-70 factor (ECF subfamily)